MKSRLLAMVSKKPIRPITAIPMPVTLTVVMNSSFEGLFVTAKTRLLCSMNVFNFAAAWEDCIIKTKHKGVFKACDSLADQALEETSLQTQFQAQTLSRAFFRLRAGVLLQKSARSGRPLR